MSASKQRRRNMALSCLGLGGLLLGLTPQVNAYGIPARANSSHSVAASNGNLDAAYQFDSNNYTLPDPSTGIIQSQPIPADFQKMAENASLALYVNRKSMAIMIKNRRTGYVWSSVPPAHELAKEQLNSDWLASVKSPLLVNYFTPDAMMNTGSFQSLGGKVEDFRQTGNGFSCILSMPEANISVRLVVSLTSNGLEIQMPDSGVKEYGSNKIASLQVYPFLGAVHEADVPGYMFIPDGSGALIRFETSHPNFSDPYVGSIYGDDLAITSTSSSNDSSASQSTAGAGSSNSATSANPAGQIYMPVFGIVHGVNQNAFMAIVEKGKYNANIVAYPSGVNTNLNWVSAQFVLRNQYFQPTSENMGGFNTFQQNRLKTDMQERYVFLSGPNANYVGMAKAYRSYLVKHGILRNEVKPSKSVPMHVEFLGAEMKPGLLRNGVVDMTTFADASQIVGDLWKHGIHHLMAVYRGWNAGGLTGQNPAMFPVASSLGGANGLRTLRDDLHRRGIPLYLYSDFTDAYHSTGQFHIRVDAVRDVTNGIISQPALTALWSLNNSRLASISLYDINPGVALNIAKADAASWKSLGIAGLALNQTGFNLFSDFNPGHPYSRAKTAATDEQIASVLKGATGSLSLYSPNDYMLPWAKDILNIPLDSSQYMYETDTVPFLETVLHGSVDYFAPYSNFDADPKEELLRMIDYGAYPSFYLTKQPSWLLENTPSEDIFTSRYSDWREEILSEYSRVNQALKRVQNATLEFRTVPTWGVAQDTYSNGIQIMVNYRQQPVTVGHVTVKARDFLVLGGKS